MNAAQSQLSDVLDTATQRLIDEARMMAGPNLRAPWTAVFTATAASRQLDRRTASLT